MVTNTPIERTPQTNEWLAAGLSAVVPGLGQWYTGRRVRGAALVALDVTYIALLAHLARSEQVALLKLWVSTTGLAVLTVYNGIALAYRAWASWDAYRAALGRESAGGAAALSVVVLALLVPHAIAGYLTWVQYSVITEVFADAPGTTTTAAQSGDTTTGPGVPVVAPPGADEPLFWDGVDRLNLLLVGADTGPGRSGIRTDTMVVVSIDPTIGETVMVSIPRNLSGIDLPEGHGIWGCDCFPRLVNDLWDAAEENPQAFPGSGEPGPRALKAALSHLLDLEIQYYAMVTLDGFVGIVDALGGVDIAVPNTIVDETYPHEDGVTIEHVVIEEGEQHLDGHLALAYARIRRHADDYARMNRQRCILGAVVDQSSPLELLTSYGAIADVLKQHLATDIPRDSLPDLIELLPSLDLDEVAILHVDREYITEQVDGFTYYDEARIRTETHELIADPARAASAEGGLNFDTTCS